MSAIKSVLSPLTIVLPSIIDGLLELVPVDGVRYLILSMVIKYRGELLARPCSLYGTDSIQTPTISVSIQPSAWADTLT